MIAEQMASSGLNVIRMNFSFNGVTPESPLDFVDLEAFSENNFSKELDDLGLVIDWAWSEEVEWWNGEEIFLIGHSRGGGVCILKAHEDHRIKKLVTWASIGVIGRFWTDEQMEAWKREGVMLVPNARTGQDMPIKWQMYEDFYANQDRLDIPKAVSALRIPYLNIHSKDDETVSFQYAEDIQKLNSEHVGLVALEKGGHTFGWKHPWTEGELPTPADYVLEQTIDFLKR